MKDHIVVFCFLDTKYLDCEPLAPMIYQGRTAEDNKLVCWSIPLSVQTYLFAHDIITKNLFQVIYEWVEEICLRPVADTPL